MPRQQLDTRLPVGLINKKVDAGNKKLPTNKDNVTTTNANLSINVTKKFLFITWCFFNRKRYRFLIW